ncbi:hypothetical protein [Methylobacterium aquaticum]|uniref:Uncharacterized protein n=1 Tax=Methylobacterium aquaticum TaxID=270351 RepID=A0A0C6FCI9_9HYPH|nr:hypothetical protein [Methylobacterium aquaticum]BAQ50421.1 hypothetical protein Maq22A_4p60365 [Methylobacterium aquaticum]
MTKALFRVAEAAPPRVHGLRLSPGDLLHADPAAVAYEVDLGHLVETTIEAEARPLVGLTNAELEALPRLEPLGDGPVEYAVGYSEARWSKGAGAPMVAVPMEPDGEGGFVGILAESAPDPAPEA